MQEHSAETLACELLMYQNINSVEQQLITLNILFIILSIARFVHAIVMLLYEPSDSYEYIVFQKTFHLLLAITFRHTRTDFDIFWQKCY